MNHLLQSRRAWFLLLCCLALLTGCRAEKPASEPAPTTTSSAPAEETSPPAESSQDPGADPESEAAVSVTGYLFDQQMLLDEMNAPWNSTAISPRRQSAFPSGRWK